MSKRITEENINEHPEFEWPDGERSYSELNKSNDWVMKNIYRKNNTRDKVQKQLEFSNQEYWVKVTGMLQQNWGVIEPDESCCYIYFFDDNSHVFDRLEFESENDAKLALLDNGFTSYNHDEHAQEFIGKPEPLFNLFSIHSPVYSSGEYWA